MENYVISLMASVKRRHHIILQFSNQNIDFNFFDAIEPHQNAKIATDLGVDITQCQLTPGEISCLLSHISLWQQMVDQQLSHMAIYEDDILLGESADQLLKSADWIPAYVDVIKLEKFADAAKMKLNAKSVSASRKIRQLTGKHLGAAAYILTLNSAEKLLTYVREQTTLIAVDHIVFEIFVANKQFNIFQLLPGVCIQSDRLYPAEKAILSDLEQERRVRFNHFFAGQKKTKRSINQKIYRELFRFVNQMCLFLGKLTFK